ncbi:MAG: hypothetical protein IPF52_14320 [Saprospiraceae bacterium]|nr:hypothetical protein [Saprospiraceae bacterium]
MPVVSGLVGHHFVSGINLEQYNVYVLTRTKKPVKAGINCIVWDPSKYILTTSFAPMLTSSSILPAKV